LKQKHLIEMPWDPVADFTTSVELFWSGRSEFDQPDQALDLCYGQQFDLGMTATS